MPNEGGPTEPEAPVDPEEPSEPEDEYTHTFDKTQSPYPFLEVGSYAQTETEGPDTIIQWHTPDGGTTSLSSESLTQAQLDEYNISFTYSDKVYSGDELFDLEYTKIILDEEGTFNHSIGANEKDVNVYFKLTNENIKTIYYIKAASKQIIAY